MLVTVNHEDYVFAVHRLKAGKTYRIPGVGIDINRFANRDAAVREAFRRRYGIAQDA